MKSILSFILLFSSLGNFSPLVREFIEARDFENGNSGRKINVLSLEDGKSKGDVELNNFVFGANPRYIH